MTEIENGIGLCTDDDDVDFYSGPTRIRCEDDDDDDDEDIILPNRSGSLATRRPLSVMRSVFDAPDFVKRIPSTQEVQAGEEIRFQCTIVGIPAPSVRWYHDEEEITDDPRYEFPCDLSTGTFACILESATKHDEGAYKCKATNSEGSSSTTGFVTVLSDHKRSKSPRRAPKRGVSYPTPFNTISEVTSDGEKEEDHQLQIRTQNYYNNLLAKERESNSPGSPPSSSGDIFDLDKDSKKLNATEPSEDVRQRLSPSSDYDVKNQGFMGYITTNGSGMLPYCRKSQMLDESYHSGNSQMLDGIKSRGCDDLFTQYNVRQNLDNSHYDDLWTRNSYDEVFEEVSSTSSSNETYPTHWQWRKPSMYSVSQLDQGLSPMETFILGVPVTTFAALYTNLPAELFVFFMIILTLQQCVLHSLNIL